MVSEHCLVIRLVAPAPATLDYGNRTVVNFQRVPGHPFEINTGTRVAVYHISDTPNNKHQQMCMLFSTGKICVTQWTTAFKLCS